MKELSVKNRERAEKKKKKLAALVNLIHLNDQQRSEKPQKDVPPPVEVVPVPPLEKSSEDGFTVVKKKSSKRKLKTDNDGVSSLTPEQQEMAPKRTKNATTFKPQIASQWYGASTFAKLSPNCKITDELCRQLLDSDNRPQLRLREFGMRASLENNIDCRVPIFLTDIQHLLMTAVIGNKSPCNPSRWCFLEKASKLTHSVVLILEGFSLFHYLANESKFPAANSIFSTRLELMMPPCKEGITMEVLMQVPITNAQQKQLIAQYGSLESAIELTKDPMLIVNAIFPIEPSMKGEDNDLAADDKFPRTKLLLSAIQMVDEGYPLPLRGELSVRFKNYVLTKPQYAPVTDHSPLFGVDCEMCRTTAGFNELTRISIVNERLETVYETFVMPTNKIVDYLTRFSGITPEIMKSVTKTLKDVQREVSALLPPDAILVGQSLNSDLNAMQMMHPYVIDTSVCFNLSGRRKFKAKLQTLSQHFLKEAIQANQDGHDSIEDSLASLKLVKLKLANSVDFGDEILVQKKRFHELIMQQAIADEQNIKSNILAVANQREKCAAIITGRAVKKELRETIEQLQKSITNESTSLALHELDSNRTAIEKARVTVLDNSLTLVSLSVSEEKLHPDNIQRTAEKLDKHIKTVWSYMARNGMLCVLMSGTPDCPSGLAKIAIKGLELDVN